MTASASGNQHSTSRRRGRLLKAVLILIVLPALLLTLWVIGALNFTYSTGQRAGYVQKLSKRGWLCKTWEGELAMANLPGTMPTIFSFTVRSDSLANVIEKSMGQRVALTYAQHKGIPGSCFGETEYYITEARPIAP